LTELLSARAETESALDVLRPCTSTSALILAADLLYETGDRHRALATIERVLSRDIDAPGARERHQKWQGKPPPRSSSTNDTTLAVPSSCRAPYRLLREVARGGCGTIYEAFDDALLRPIAFKLYHRPKEDQQQLLRECRTAVRFSGPCVVSIYDANLDEGWIALEWVANGSIRDCLRNKRFEDLTPVMNWVRPLAHTLARIHQAKYLHADIKPANVLLKHSQCPVLTDFGIATAQGSPPVGGSRGYLSPERLAGKALTPSDDVYAFGRIIEDVVQQLPLAEKDPVVQTLITRCLAPEHERPKDACELAAMIELVHLA